MIELGKIMPSYTITDSNLESYGFAEALGVNNNIKQIQLIIRFRNIGLNLLKYDNLQSNNININLIRENITNLFNEVYNNDLIITDDNNTLIMMVNGLRQEYTYSNKEQL